MTISPAPITELLARAQAGDRGASERVVPLVYSELQRIARRQLRKGPSAAPTPTLDTGALVHEAWLKLGAGDLELRSREHFFAVAARAMRQLLIDEARRRRRLRRGGGEAHLPLDPRQIAVAAQGEQLLALDRALDRLAELDPRLRDLVELRFFGGLTEVEAAQVLGISDRTVRRDWGKARALLAVELGDGAPAVPGAG